MYIVYVGDVTNDLAEAAKKIDPQAYLITASNVRNEHQGTVYCSLGDLTNLDDFFQLLSKASRIVYTPPRIWSDGNTVDIKYSMAWLTVHYIQTVSRLFKITVDNFKEFETASLEKTISRQTDSPEVWIFGCSSTQGFGVEIDQRYANLLAKHIELPLNIVAANGASNGWVRDQLLRSDIRPGDLVIWGLTSASQFYWYDQKTVKHIHDLYYKMNPEFGKLVSFETLNHPHRIYDTLNAVDQVKNFCKKIQARLLLVSIHAEIEISAELAKEDNFLMLRGARGLDWSSDFLDSTPDNLHPGSKTHKMYAEKILAKLQQLEYI